MALTMDTEALFGGSKSARNWTSSLGARLNECTKYIPAYLRSFVFWMPQGRRCHCQSPWALSQIFMGEQKTASD